MSGDSSRATPPSLLSRQDARSWGNGPGETLRNCGDTAPQVPPRRWHWGWTRAGEVVRYGARTFECLKDTPGRPSDRPRASHIWRPLD